jgi:predicted transcriptional regulator
MDNPAETLLNEVERFLDRTGTTPTSFGTQALRDPNFVWHLRAGREPRFSTVKRVLEFISSNEERAS